MNIISFDLETCDSTQCDIPGETCIGGSCMCGGYESCTKHVLDVNNPDQMSQQSKQMSQTQISNDPLYALLAGKVTCDALVGSCICNKNSLCPESQKWCTSEGCKCSKAIYTYTIGDDTSQGTCNLASDVCSKTGNCDGE